MGITVHAARALISAYQRGVSFEAALSVGRQELLLPLWQVGALFEAVGCAPAGRLPLPSEDPDWTYAEPFFECLGAKRVDAIDASDFEGAGLVHDLNHPIPESLVGRYDVVYDGGSLEHVFNVPMAIQNYMRLVKVGGRVMIHAPGNNWFGHGFYQFSPELFFRVFSAGNGFRIEQLKIMEEFQEGRCYEMRDPARVGQRAETRTAHPVLIFLEAEKVEDVPKLFRALPQQSDYASQWDTRSTPDRARICPRPHFLERVLRRLPRVSHRWEAWKDLRRGRKRGFERLGKFYTRVE